MKELVQNFSKQLRAALDIAQKAIITPGRDFDNIVISGLGGSGIGGSVLAELVASTCPVPIVTNNDYFMPAFVGERTLVIISSYSGNTEETTSAMQQAIKRGANIVCITSGGKVLEMARAAQLDFIEIPGGMPPRSCFGYSFVQLIKILVAKDCAPKSLLTDIEKTITLLDSENDSIKSEAMLVAQKLHGKIPVLYSLGSCDGVMVRFRQQINENGKMLCWHHKFPEMNHNELVGWVDRNENLAVVTFRTSFDFERTQKRYEFCKPLFASLSSGVTDIYAKGHSLCEQFIYLVNIGDWISCYLADLKGIDPVEVKVIDRLKAELSKF